MNYSIYYKVHCARPETHLFDVTLAIPEPLKNQQVTLPAWIPGSYMIRDFARNIVSIKADTNGQLVSLVQVDKQTWQVQGLVTPINISYQIYAQDLSVRGAHLDTTHAYFNGSCLFLKPLGQEDKSISVEIFAPIGADYQDWCVATSLQPVVTGDNGFGQYQAVDYSDLIDRPVEMGTYEQHQFRIQNVLHRMVFTGRNRGDIPRICEDMSRICAQHAAMFGELPIQNYLFMTQLTANGYGGLEHSNSTSLICRRDDLPVPGHENISTGYRQFLGLCSHEYFHLWNVKRIQPEVLKQADLSTEVHTELLWAFEGITSYYDDLALMRSGCIPMESYLELLAQTVTRVMRGSGRHKQSIADSSFNAWTRFYKQDENAPNAIVSYYTKGSLVALGLDLFIRTSTEDSATLDTLMRSLWERHGKLDNGVPEQGISNLVSEICGCDISSFFADYVHGVIELPLKDWLSQLGIGYRLRPRNGNDDMGSFVCQPEVYKTPLTMGVRYKQKGDLVLIEHTSDTGAAQAAGLSAGDRLIAIDTLQISAVQLDKGFPGYTAGDVLEVLAFRDDQLMTFQVELVAAPDDTCELWLMDDSVVKDTQRKRQVSWSSGY